MFIFAMTQEQFLSSQAEERCSTWPSCLLYGEKKKLAMWFDPHDFSIQVLISVAVFLLPDLQISKALLTVTKAAQAKPAKCTRKEKN